MTIDDYVYVITSIEVATYHSTPIGIAFTNEECMRVVDRLNKAKKGYVHSASLVPVYNPNRIGNKAYVLQVGRCYEHVSYAYAVYDDYSKAKKQADWIKNASWGTYCPMYTQIDFVDVLH